MASFLRCTVERFRNMRSIPAVLEIVIQLRTRMATGQSISSALHQLLSESTDPFRLSLRNWHKRIEAGQEGDKILASLPELSKTQGRRSLILILSRGLGGCPIDETLKEIEQEFF